MDARLAAALDAVSAALRVARAVQAELDSVRTLTKDDRSPVTVADFAAQGLVAHRLSTALGPVRLVGEESRGFLLAPEHRAHLQATLRAVRPEWPEVDEARLLEAIGLGEGEPGGSFWTLDPIDGTKGFLRGQHYCVSLAYLEGGAPVLGVLGCPNLSLDPRHPLDQADATGSIYYAVRGEGAFEMAPSGTERRRFRRADLAAGDAITLCESVEAAHSDHDASARLLTRLGADPKPPARLDSQCKYAVVARGQADVYLRVPATADYVEKLWDHAAGALVAEEAGCTVSDVRGHPLDFGRGRGLDANRGILVAAPSLHARILRAL